MKRFVVILSAIALSWMTGTVALTQGPPELFVNELMSGNDFALCDHDGNDPDWAEIYNGGQTEVDISGWFLSDEEENLRRYRIPDVPSATLDPGDFLLVFVSGKDKVVENGSFSEVHTNFRLKYGGEILVLTDDSGTEVNRLSFDSRPQRDWSFGRSTDLNEFLHFEAPTPGLGNNAAPDEVRAFLSAHGWLCPDPER